MTGSRHSLEMQKLSDALSRLGEALAEPTKNLLIIDGTIQRFEFVFEQSWKTLKKFLADEGIEAGTPREVIKKAYQAGWLKNEEEWLSILKDRNETSHTYNEGKAREIFKKMPSHFQAFEACYRYLNDLSK